jgi:prolyl-tRNA editing enzyme YbaK/EbsC (Cys-tRNA(Pro) deacylase)
MRERVITAARDLGLELRVTSAPQPARTVEAAARAVACEPSRIARAEVWVADGDPVVIVLSGTRQVDPERACALLDCAEIRRAGAAEVRSITGFAPGSLCAIGAGLPVVIDEALLRHERVWTLAGDSSSLAEVASRELAARLEATVGEVVAPDAG